MEAGETSKALSRREELQLWRDAKLCVVLQDKEAKESLCSPFPPVHRRHEVPQLRTQQRTRQTPKTCTLKGAKAQGLSGKKQTWVCADMSECTRLYTVNCTKTQVVNQELNSTQAEWIGLWPQDHTQYIYITQIY